MSEFKGTKDKWVLLIGYKSCGVSIGNRSTMVFSSDCEEDKSNALLISKAPEMLEMLKEVLAGEIQPIEYQSDWDMVNELIKSATEVKEDK